MELITNIDNVYVLRALSKPAAGVSAALRRPGSPVHPLSSNSRPPLERGLLRAARLSSREALQRSCSGLFRPEHRLGDWLPALLRRKLMRNDLRSPAGYSSPLLRSGSYTSAASMVWRLRQADVRGIVLAQSFSQSIASVPPSPAAPDWCVHQTWSAPRPHPNSGLKLPRIRRWYRALTDALYAKYSACMGIN